MASTLVQYVIVREDLRKTLKWPVGALIAQGCHACTAVIHSTYTDEQTQAYLKDIDNMHKIILKAPNAESLEKLAESLKSDNIFYKLWIEQPENIPTCLAVKPYERSQVKNYFKEFKLFA